MCETLSFNRLIYMGELRPGVIFLDKQQDRVFLPVVRGVGQAALQK